MSSGLRKMESDHNTGLPAGGFRSRMDSAPFRLSLVHTGGESRRVEGG